MMSDGDGSTGNVEGSTEEGDGVTDHADGPTDDDEFDILLVEDNPGDARLIEEMLWDAEELLLRVTPDEAAADVPAVLHEQRLSAGLERLREGSMDVVLLDLNLPDSTGLDTLETAVETAESTPIIVLTGMDEGGVGIEAIQRGAQDYLVKDEVTSGGLVRSIHYAVERHRQERERARRREELEALNRLNRISQEITHDVITTENREALQRAVCERLVASDAYRFAWIGDVEWGSEQVSPLVGAGVEEGYLDQISITLDDNPTGRGPTGRAVENGEVQVTNDVEDDPSYEPWREAAVERGYRSSAAVPIAHEDVIYGVLNVYAAEPDAFTGRETEILRRLGDVIGHALAAIDRKDALLGDSVLELEFGVEEHDAELVGLTASGGELRIDHLVRTDDSLVVYGEADGVDRDELRDAAERTDTAETFRVLSGTGDAFEFELVTGMGASLLDAIATHGGRARSVTVSDGALRFTVEFPPGQDVRQLVELVQEHCPGATPISKRTTERADADVLDTRSVLEQQLTEKQRTALETAYFAGHFDWPRTSTGEDVAEMLGVTPATFNQHIRTAERKFFDAVFRGDPDEGPSTDG